MTSQSMATGPMTIGITTSQSMTTDPSKLVTIGLINDDRYNIKLINGNRSNDNSINDNRYNQ